ncbi:uncharacterized protein M6B38_365930 [Iris pallida]|uniref:Nitrate regulatory gene2 protein n=1 Tax=Iris pallida TaxID=29817 RepID=A0AAX6GH53_IRIPA|nr:uncharacterized protein M6B38_365930 [Iris pallida]
MGNCTASRLGSGSGIGGPDEEDAVGLCRDRKRLLKSAVERRYALAEAHQSYVLSLRSVAAAIHLFVARHSAPTPILITLPPQNNTPPPPPAAAHHLPPLPPSLPPQQQPSLLHQQTPTEAKSEVLLEGNNFDHYHHHHHQQQQSVVQMGSCSYFFPSMHPPSPPPQASDFEWDFFNPFDSVRAAEEAAMLSGLCRSTDEDLRAVREQEGIPELEEEEEEEEEEEDDEEEVETKVHGGVVKAEEVGNGGGGGGGEERGERGLAVTETPAKERELLDALRDVEDQFIRAFDSGKDLCRMLEVNQFQLHSALEEIKENSSKLIQAITWHRSPSTQSSSYKTDPTPYSGDAALCNSESKSDIFEDFCGMESGSHSQTLGRLYAWEKKLYEEVKAGDHTRQVYEKKCVKLRNKDAKGVDSRSVDKTRASLRDLYTRIWVALRSIETISIRIQKVRDEELHPQLIELLHGLMRTWKIMLESHETQKEIMLEVRNYRCSAYGKFCSDSQRQVTVRLEAELRNWRTCFMSYVEAMRAYIDALDGWLSKFFVPDIEYYSRHRSSVPLHSTVGAPPLLVICHKWSDSLKKLPDKPVSYAMKGFIRNIRLLWLKQGEEQQQKRKVDSLAKELDRRVLAFQKTENKVLESKLCDFNPEPDVREKVDYLAGRRDLLDMFRKKLDIEKAKHHNSMQETQRVRLDGFKEGFVGIFESLTEFSKDCVKLYNELLVHNEKALADEAEKNPSFIVGSQVEEGNRRLRDGGDDGLP